MIDGFKEMVNYVLKDVDQIELTITKVDPGDYHFQIRTVKNEGTKYKSIDGTGFNIKEAMYDWNDRQHQWQVSKASEISNRSKKGNSKGNSRNQTF